LNKASERILKSGQHFAGEFIVIVLGVLAALAVESWSEDRGDRILEENYLFRLQGDLKRDLQQIGRARWASFAKARATTTLLYAIDDPLASEIPEFTESIKSIDFSVPATDVISVEHMGGLVWIAKRDRTLGSSRGAYDEMIATGRFLVIEDDQLRAEIIDYYSSVDDGEGLADWIAEASSRLEEVLEPSGLNAFDYNYIEDPLPRLRDLSGLAVVLRDIRRRSLRHVEILEQVEASAKELTEGIDEYLTNK
jgi:hypothetical protein